MTHIFRYGRAQASADAAAADRSSQHHHEQRRRFGDSRDMSQIALCGLSDDDPLNPVPAILIDYLDRIEGELCPACALRAKEMGFDHGLQAQATGTPPRS